MPALVRALTQNDAVTLDAFLRPHTAEAFFLRSNALMAGLDYEGMPLQGQYIGAFNAANQMIGAMSFSWIKTILLFAKDTSCLPAMADHMRQIIAKRGGQIDAILGLKDQTDLVIQSWGLTSSDFRTDMPDWLFELDMTRFKRQILASQFRARRAEPRDLDVISAWRATYFVEISNKAASPEVEKEAREEMQRRMESQQLFVLEKQGKLVSFCGFTGNPHTINDSIIIGPVWVPPEERGHGYGRLITSAMIDHIACDWKTLKKVTLFASRPDAIKIYESLGFVRIADWRLAFLREDYEMTAR